MFRSHPCITVKKQKKKIHKKVVREEVYSDWVSNPDIIGHFIK